VGRREFRAMTERAPEVPGPTRPPHAGFRRRSRRVGAQGGEGSVGGAGSTVRVYAELLPASDGTAPFSSLPRPRLRLTTPGSRVNYGG
jgi:hypothetical protein